ncbi:MAG TPA: class I SAM-dependent methyltransferase [Smithellaceae bacterium]|nr:class I SAM-dependent methyltransferase [Smithellaceae bacterium]HRS90078.1 class I SAM-dependent methyltransferase [Smithellaceae bacterium]HRV26928.1 class I SAM-dependent methyltransferase [Smithellaceae bacterium]
MEPKNIPQGRLYKDLAYLFELVTPREDYAEEAAQWLAILCGKLGPGKHNILELGVGAGHNVSYLTDDFEVTAADASEEMLKLCRNVNPGVELHMGDMRDIRLHKQFDAVLIHDAIVYMLSQDDLARVFATAARHLKPGGIFITGPDYYRDTFSGPRVEYFTRSDSARELTYIEYVYDPDPSDTTMEIIFTFFIREKGQLRIEHDRHITGLFPRASWIKLMEKAGFAVEPKIITSAGVPHELLVGTLRGN